MLEVWRLQTGASLRQPHLRGDVYMASPLHWVSPSNSPSNDSQIDLDFIVAAPHSGARQPRRPLPPGPRYRRIP